MSSLDAYWRAYENTLARIRAEKPDTFAALKAILDAFEPPSSGDAFFPDGADDTLADALEAAGWRVEFREASYVYYAKHSTTSARLSYFEGDLFEGIR